MRHTRPAVFAAAIATLCCAITPDHARAANGINFIGYGNESEFMAGADVAVARDSSALSTNPAGMSQVRGSMLDFHQLTLYTMDVTYQDSFNSRTDTSKKWYAGGEVGYATRPEGQKLSWGIGLFGQGGTGVRFSELNTAFGTRDRLSSATAIAKLTGGVAYEVEDGTSIGLSVPVFYAATEQAVFPNTSAGGFSGYELKGASGVAVGFRVGIQRQFSTNVRAGLVYGSRVNLNLEQGRMQVNMTGFGLGIVNYRDVSIEGLRLPQEVAAGLAWQATTDWLLSTKIMWLDWSAAMREQTVTARDPDNAFAPSQLTTTTALNWRDQYVFALGTEYKVTPRLSVLGGYNYGRSPQPANTTSPIFIAGSRQHLTLGSHYRWSEQTRLSGGIEYVFPETVVHTNSQAPFGTNAVSRGELLYLHIGLSRYW